MTTLFQGFIFTISPGQFGLHQFTNKLAHISESYVTKFCIYCLSIRTTASCFYNSGTGKLLPRKLPQENALMENSPLKTNLMENYPQKYILYPGKLHWYKIFYGMFLFKYDLNKIKIVLWIFRVDSQFQIYKIIIRSGFDLMTRDSYFTILVEVFTSHILSENTYFTYHIK